MRPLSALLSQMLVAFTIELDNEFERQMLEAGYPGAGLSLRVWSNLMRFLADGPVTVGGLAARSPTPANRLKFQLGCLERWGFVVPETAQPGDKRKRDGWGSARGIRADCAFRLTTKGMKAVEVWPPLLGMIEGRWEARFGKSEISRLRESLQVITDTSGRIPLVKLLSRLLRACKVEFESEATAPLELSANVIRVLSDKPMPVAEIPRLTGGSPETTAIGWRLKKYVAVKAAPGESRGKVACLTPLGLEAQRTYHRLVREMEKRWKVKFGAAPVERLRDSLEGLLDASQEGRPLIAVGLIPPKGIRRAGDEAAALGRKDIGPAARQRTRDLVAQTKVFVEDPAGSLPHYPLWDMNRGFGP